MRDDADDDDDELSLALFSQISSALSFSLPPPRREDADCECVSGVEVNADEVDVDDREGVGVAIPVTASLDEVRFLSACSACCSAGLLVRRTPGSALHTTQSRLIKPATRPEPTHPLNLVLSLNHSQRYPHVYTHNLM